MYVCMCSGVELDIRKWLIQQFYFRVTWFDCLVGGHRMLVYLNFFFWAGQTVQVKIF